MCTPSSPSVMWLQFVPVQAIVGDRLGGLVGMRRSLQFVPVQSIVGDRLGGLVGMRRSLQFVPVQSIVGDRLGGLVGMCRSLQFVCWLLASCLSNMQVDLRDGHAATLR